MRRFDRRRLLKSLGAAALCLPLLPSVERSARAAGQPKRMILLYSSCGTITDAFDPTSGTDGLQFGEILAPLDKHRDDIIVVRGLDSVAAMNSKDGAGGHGAGTAIRPPWPGTSLHARPHFARPTSGASVAIGNNGGSEAHVGLSAAQTNI